MKATIQKTTEANGHPVFHNVGENLYRLETSGGYYALIKKGGKQFRRSLKTKDRKLAERRLSELKEKVGVLRITEDAHVNFRTLADRWLDSRKHKLAESTAEWYGYLIKNLAEFFGDAAAYAGLNNTAFTNAQAAADNVAGMATNALKLIPNATTATDAIEKWDRILTLIVGRLIDGVSSDRNSLLLF